MKITDTSIVKTEITKYCIEIHFQPEDSESSAEPVIIRVVPNKNHIYLNLSRAEFASGGNVRTIPFEKID